MYIIKRLAYEHIDMGVEYICIYIDRYIMYIYTYQSNWHTFMICIK